MSDAPAKDSPKPASEAVPAKEAATDVVLVGPPTQDGGGVHILRAREQGLEAGELRPLQEGRPITGEIVTLAPRKDQPRVFDVKDSYRPPTTTSSSMTSSALPHKGPANVATKAYREGWDEVFGKPPPAPKGAPN
jgi:hypothetical protein